jgi:nicotinamide mononucleotide transporter
MNLLAMNLSPLSTEITGNVLGLWCIWLIARNNVWNWPVGILNCVFYIALFYPARLYGDCMVQAVYIVLAVVGIYQWLFGLGGVRKRREGAITERPISRSTPRDSLRYLLAFTAGWLLLGWFLGRYTDTDVAWWDGATTSACFVATWILAWRKIENWWVWIGTNVSYFFLYQHKGLVITQWCQIVFLAVSVAGYLKWAKALNSVVPEQPETKPAAVTA